MNTPPYFVDYRSNQSLDGIGDDEIIYYFAYGSNLDKEQIEHRRLIGSRTLWQNDPAVEVKKAVPMGIAILEGYALNFNKLNSIKYGSHFASIAPKTNATVEGVIYQLDKKFIQILDYFEGVSSSQYTRELVTVALKIQGKADELVPALVYIAHTNASIKTGEQGTPTKTYLDTILRGAINFGLSQETIAKLETWPTAKQ